MKQIVWKEFTFDSAHKLENTEKCDYGKCNNIHGHTYKLQVGIENETNPDTSMVINFNDLKKIVNEKIIDVVDHSFLNESMQKLKEGIYHTTCEVMAVIFQEILQNEFKKILGDKVKVSIRLWETPTSFMEVLA